MPQSDRSTELCERCRHGDEASVEWKDVGDSLTWIKCLKCKHETVLDSMVWQEKLRTSAPCDEAGDPEDPDLPDTNSPDGGGASAALDLNRRECEKANPVSVLSDFFVGRVPLEDAHAAFWDAMTHCPCRCGNRHDFEYVLDSDGTILLRSCNKCGDSSGVDATHTAEDVFLQLLEKGALKTKPCISCGTDDVNMFVCENDPIHGGPTIRCQTCQTLQPLISREEFIAAQGGEGTGGNGQGQGQRQGKSQSASPSGPSSAKNSPQGSGMSSRSRTTDRHTVEDGSRKNWGSLATEATLEVLHTAVDIRGIHKQMKGGHISEKEFKKEVIRKGVSLFGSLAGTALTAYFQLPNEWLEVGYSLGSMILKLF